MSEIHPAIAAAHESWRCVRHKLRDEWFALLADDVVIEDPIGIGPTNPTGKGIQGKEGAKQFWENNVARTEAIEFEAHESFAAGKESAHLLTLTTRFPGGTAMIVHGIFTYTIDDEGKIKALRGYWSLEESKVVKSQA